MYIIMYIAEYAHIPACVADIGLSLDQYTAVLYRVSSTLNGLND